MNWANMNRVKIEKFNAITHKEGTKEQFLQPIDWKYYDTALQNLSANAFKLWFYLLKWQGQGYYDFSPANLCKVLNIKSKNTIYAAREELVQQNYLIEEDSNCFIFYPCGNADLIYQKLT